MNAASSEYYGSQLWTAWHFYQNRQYAEMADCLYQASQQVLCKSQVINLWINTFSQFAVESGDFDIHVLTNLPEWQQLIHRLLFPHLSMPAGPISAWPINNFVSELSVSELPVSELPVSLPQGVDGLLISPSTQGIESTGRFSAPESAPESAQKSVQAGEVFYQQEQWEAAVTAFEQAIELDPACDRAYLGLGNTLALLERYEDAIAVYQRLIELMPDSWEGHHKLADVWLNQAQWQPAATAYRNTIALNPSLSWAYHNLGKALVELKEWQESAEASQQAIELDPDFPWSYYHLAEALMPQHRWQEAVTAYRHFLRLNPAFIYGYQCLGDALRELILSGERAPALIEEAVQCYRQIIEVEPDNLQIYYKILDLKTTDSDIYSQLAQAAVRQQQIEKAIVFYQIGLSVDPDNEAIRSELNTILKQIAAQSMKIGPSAKSIHETGIV